MYLHHQLLNQRKDNLLGPPFAGIGWSNSVKKRQAVASSGWEAAAVVGGSAVEGRGSVILQRQVLQSCFDPGLVPQIQFIDRVDGVRDGALLVLPSVVHRDRYPQCFPFVWLVCCSTLTRSSMLWTRLLYGGL